MSLNIPAIIDKAYCRNAEIDLAFVALGARTVEQARARNSHVDVGALLNDATAVREIERLASMVAVRELALEMQLTGSLSESVALLAEKAQGEEIGSAALATISDSLVKVSNLLERREAARRDSGVAGPVRHMFVMGDRITITTIVDAIEFFRSEPVTEDEEERALLAMRCTTEEEIARVLATLHSPRYIADLKLRDI